MGSPDNISGLKFKILKDKISPIDEGSHNMAVRIWDELGQETRQSRT
jgi:hypothetical protein